jgi:hypothetical protein
MSNLAALPPLPPRCGSWIIVRKSDGHAVLETFSRKVASCVNGALYEVLTAADYLGRTNGKD